VGTGLPISKNKKKSKKETKVRKKIFLALFSFFFLVLFYNLHNVTLNGFFSLHFVFSLCIGCAGFFLAEN
jgi:hypothetical protein